MRLKCLSFAAGPRFHVNLGAVNAEIIRFILFTFFLYTVLKPVLSSKYSKG